MKDFIPPWLPHWFWWQTDVMCELLDDEWIMDQYAIRTCA
jgi:hypothetical protein